MKIRRGMGLALVGAGLVGSSCTAGREELTVGADAGVVRTATASLEHLESSAAATRIAELQARFRVAVSAPVAIRFEAASGADAETHLHPVLPSEARAGVARTAHVALPVRANDEVKLEDDTSHVSVRFALANVESTHVTVAGGMALYRGALHGADVVHRVHAEGTEDFVVFETRPALEELRYLVDVSRVPGLRLVSNTLEFLDEGGTPVLRVAPPYVVDANGASHAATLAVSGCAYDTNPAGPWGRKVTRPGADRCALSVAWSGAIAYPAIVDPAWVATGSMADYRGDHTASLLGSGNVLVAGGHRGLGCINSAELFDPVARTFAATGSLATARQYHTASTLASGKILIAGGYDCSPIYASGHTFASAEIYDPGTGQFTATGPMSVARMVHASTMLPSGKALVAGGYTAPFASVTATAELFDPAGNGGIGSFTTTGSMSMGRTGHSASLLGSGKALVAGGADTNGTNLATAELFDPAGNAGAGSFTTTGSMSVARAGHTASLLASGKVLVASGGSADLFNPAGNAGAGTFSATGPMVASRAQHTASVLPSGKVLLAGGLIGGSASTSTELFDPAGNAGAGTFTAATPMGKARNIHTASVFPSGQVLMAGGNLTVASAELYGGAPGDACSLNGYCLSGYCADGVCCDVACNGGGCDRCDLPGTVGTCTLAPSHNPGANAACSFPFACDGVNVTCPTACTSDAACAPAYYCAQNGTCQPQKAQAAACNTQTDCKVPGACHECTSGFCVDGVCCDTQCSDGLCQACAAALKQTGLADGTCGPTKDGVDPRNECTASGVLCGADGQCNGTGACRAYTPTGVSCGASTCQDNLAKGQLCNGAGTCNSNAGFDCTPYGCTAGGCATTCATSANCAATAWCKSGTCIPKSPKGSACSTAESCTSAFCADGICCDKACAGQCEACDSFAGTCGPISGAPHGKRPPCAAGFVCDSATSMCGPPPAAATCDGDHMTTGADGTTQDCAPYKCDSNGTCRPPTCASVSDCVAPTICDPNGKCVVPDSPTGGSGGCAVAVVRGSASAPSLAWLAAIVACTIAALTRRRRRLDR